MCAAMQQGLTEQSALMLTSHPGRYLEPLILQDGAVTKLSYVQAFTLRRTRL